MVSARAIRGAALGGIALLALSQSETDAFAQGKSSQTPAPSQPQASGKQKRSNPWYKLCNDIPVPEPVKPGDSPKQQKPEEMKNDQVGLTQADVRDRTTAMLVGKLAIRQIAGEPKAQILVMLPLGSSLPPGALVKLDDKEPIKLVYTNCERVGCYAEGNIEPALIDQIKAGKQIAYLGIDVTGRALSIPLPLEGFAKAIDGPPMPAKTYFEQQHKIAEIINANLAELRKKEEEAAKSQNAQAAAPAQSNKKGR